MINNEIHSTERVILAVKDSVPASPPVPELGYASIAAMLEALNTPATAANFWKMDGLEADSAKRLALAAQVTGDGAVTAQVGVYQVKRWFADGDGGAPGSSLPIRLRRIGTLTFTAHATGGELPASLADASLGFRITTTATLTDDGLLRTLVSRDVETHDDAIFGAVANIIDRGPSEGILLVAGGTASSIQITGYSWL